MGAGSGSGGGGGSDGGGRGGGSVGALCPLVRLAPVRPLRDLSGAIWGGESSPGISVLRKTTNMG